MGCAVSSNSGDDGSNPRVFDVANIDDSGHERSTGKIEVTPTELILYYPGREPLRWPLQGLRRYGYNGHLFSFESGRRCPTGHGIYAFHCSSAEQLFRQLQQSIIRAGEERGRTSVTGTGGEDPCLTSADCPTTQQQNSILEGIDQRFANYINESQFGDSWRTYVNQDPVDQSLKDQQRQSIHDHPQKYGVQYIELDFPVFCESLELLDYDEEEDVFQSPEVSTDDYFRPTYINVPVTAQECTIPLISRESRSLIRENNTTNAGTASLVTYAQLDLRNVDGLQRLSSSLDATNPERPKFVCRPRVKPETYATIDFQRTRALSTKTTENMDEGFRKTRHSSNIELLIRN